MKVQDSPTFLKVGVDTVTKQIVVAFEEPVRNIVMSVDQAQSLSVLIQEKVDVLLELERQKSKQLN